MVEACSTQTATDATTVTETATDTPDSVTITETVTATSTTTVAITSTPTTVVPLTCQPTDYNLQVSTPATGGPYRMWLYGSANQVIWAGYGAAGTPRNPGTIWSLDNNSYIQAYSTKAILYVPVGSSAASLPVKLGDRATVDAGVAAGTIAAIKGCVDADTGRFTMSVNGRQNLVQCGSGIFIFSGNGADAGSTCVQVIPTGVKAYL